jgi:hypothetical protein
MKRVLIAATVLVALLVAGAIYYRVGWTRMEAACTSSPPGTSWQNAYGSYSFTKDGFTCELEDGTIRSSWWF